MPRAWKRVGNARVILEEPELLCQVLDAAGEWKTVKVINELSDDFAYTNADHWLSKNQRSVAS